MTRILAAAAQHGHLPVHVTAKMGEGIAVVLVLLIIAAFVTALRSS